MLRCILHASNEIHEHSGRARSRFGHPSRIGVASIALAVVFLSLAASSALAKPAKLCIPEKSGARVVSDTSQGTCKASYKFAELGKEGEPASPGEEGICVPLSVSRPVLTPNSHDECPAHYTFVATGATLGGSEGKEGKEGEQGPAGKEGAEGKEGKEGKQSPASKEGPEGKNALSAGELAELKSILPDIKFNAAGIGGKPTIQFSGVNVQVVNGMGQTTSTNGACNLVIGYDPSRETDQLAQPRTRSRPRIHQLCGILSGGENAITAPFADVLASQGNHASSILSAVLGGENNSASEQSSVVVRGNANEATGSDSTVLGGYEGNASGNTASLSGGEHNTAAGEDSSVLGGSHVDLTGVAAVSP